MNRILYLLPLFAAGIGLSIVGLGFIGEDVLPSILPELFGFFLEGIVFVLVFQYFEKRRTARSEKELKSNLKNSLITFLSIYIWWASRSDACSPQEDLEGLCDIESALLKINHELESGVTENFSSFHVMEFAKRQESEMLSLLPVAAQIGPKHLFHWGLIQLSLSKLANAHQGNQGSLKRLKDVLVEARAFIELEIDNDK